MMQEIMDQEERVMLDQIAKLTEENHVEWACDEYNPIGFLDKDDDSEQSACICQMFQFSAVLNGFHYELELAEYINVPSGKIDLSVTLMHTAVASGRWCGGQWPQCGLSGHHESAH